MKVVNALLDFVRDLVGLSFQIMWAAREEMQGLLMSYINLLKKLAILSAAVMVISTSALVVGVQLQSPALNAFALSIVGILSLVWIILMIPMSIAKELAPRQIRKPVDRTIRYVVSLGFGTAVIGCYFYIVPVWNKPQFVPAVLVGLASLIFAFSRMEKEMDKKKLVRFVVFLIAILTMTFYIPDWPERVARSLNEANLARLRSEAAQQIKPESLPAPQRATNKKKASAPQKPEAEEEPEETKSPPRREIPKNWREAVRMKR